METPNEFFYVRNHLPVPQVDAKVFCLTVTAEGVSKTLELSLDELKQMFPVHTISGSLIDFIDNTKSHAATIQCAGNRRNEMSRERPVKGGAWELGAISNASWTGVKLRDVLVYLGVDPDSAALQHVQVTLLCNMFFDKLQLQFEGLDRDFEKAYAASIPFEKAVSKTVCYF